MTKFIVSLLSCCFCLFGNAEQKQVFSNYEVHYSAFNTLDISPEIANNYQIKRSESIGLLNISVLNNLDHTPLEAQLIGYAHNLIGQRQTLEFKLVSEQQSRYYLANFRFSTEELLHFTIDVLPQGEKFAQTLKFQKIFYQD